MLGNASSLWTLFSERSLLWKLVPVRAYPWQRQHSCQPILQHRKPERLLFVLHRSRWGLGRWGLGQFSMLPSQFRCKGFPSRLNRCGQPQSCLVRRFPILPQLPLLKTSVPFVPSQLLHHFPNHQQELFE